MNINNVCCDICRKSFRQNSPSFRLKFLKCKMDHKFCIDHLGAGDIIDLINKNINIKILSMIGDLNYILGKFNYSDSKKISELNKQINELKLIQRSININKTTQFAVDTFNQLVNTGKVYLVCDIIENCPICNFEVLIENDIIDYMFKEKKISYTELKKNIKSRFKKYNDFINYIR